MHFDTGSMQALPEFLAWLVVTAFFGKVISAGLPALPLGFTPREALAVGVGMSARGAVELIVADIAPRAGLFDVLQPVPEIIHYLFSAVVIMALATTLLTPLTLRWVRPRREKDISRTTKRFR